MANHSLNIPYMVLTGTVLIGVVLIIAVYQPMASETIELRNKVEDNEIILKDREDHLRNIQNRVSALNSQSEHEERLNVVLPNDDSLEDVLRIIHVAAQESGGEVSSISSQSSSVQEEASAQRVRGEGSDITPSVTPLAFNIQFSGTYRELRVFLENIEKAPRIMDVLKISMEKAQESEAINATMTVQFYKYNLIEFNT